MSKKQCSVYGIHQSFFNVKLSNIHNQLDACVNKLTQIILQSKRIEPEFVPTIMYQVRTPYGTEESTMFPADEDVNEIEFTAMARIAKPENIMCEEIIISFSYNRILKIIDVKCTANKLLSSEVRKSTLIAVNDITNTVFSILIVDDENELMYIDLSKLAIPASGTN